MGFCEMVEILQRRNKEKIVICKNGNFYTAIGKDAIIKLYEEEDKKERQIEIEEYAKQKRKKAIIWKNIKKKKTD